jgi:hypothetical protein
MSKKVFKKVTAYYPVEDVVCVELLLEVDKDMTDLALRSELENSDLEDFDEKSGIELHGNEIIDRDYSTDPTDDWQDRISVYEIEEITDEEWEESYA